MKNIKMRTCKICSRTFSKPYNLRVHHARFHPTKSALKLERQARDGFSEVDDVGMRQYGGRVHEPDDDDSEDDDDGDSMTNNVGSTSESDAESDTSMASVDDDNNPDWVFDSIIEEAEEELGRYATHKDLQKRLRYKLVDKMKWVHNFRKHPIYKKIMETVRELQDGPEEYDRDEAFSVAVDRRKFLLNRLVPEPDDDERSEPDNEDDSDSTREDDIQV